MPARTPSRRPRTGALLTALLTCAALTACAGPAPSAAAPPAAASAPAPSAPTPTTTHGQPSARDAADATDATDAPTQVTVPSLKISSPLMRLGLNADGTVEVPPAEKGMTAGWSTGGAVPGRPGPAVLIGHNDTRFGRAVFHDLKDIRKGAEVVVRDGAGTPLRFTVTSKETVSKKAFPTERVYGATKDSTLRLVTCDGAFDAEGHPVDNLIVYAELS
ncbi:sortase domain-containing protein [Streptomyces sp. bgisy029]|uniref:sortase domain-containing protein n=1 Tax=Streptomyces sp. bgisy029 TaxID=3413771 RepID=UPI003D70C74A